MARVIATFDGQENTHSAAADMMISGCISIGPEGNITRMHELYTTGVYQ